MADAYSPHNKTTWVGVTFPAYISPEHTWATWRPPQQDGTRMAKTKHIYDSQPFDMGVAVHVDAGRVFTTVMLTGDRYAAIGTAKRNPRDTHSLQIGVDIAMSRALRELADKLEAGA